MYVYVIHTHGLYFIFYSFIILIFFLVIIFIQLICTTVLNVNKPQYSHTRYNVQQIIAM